MCSSDLRFDEPTRTHIPSRVFMTTSHRSPATARPTATRTWPTTPWARMNESSPRARRPAFRGWIPSTSFAGSSASITVDSAADGAAQPTDCAPVPVAASCSLRDALAAQFPVLQRRLDDQPVVYLDSANTSQKPQVVIDAMTTFLEQSYAPINRSAYRLAAEATDASADKRGVLDALRNSLRACRCCVD